MIFGLLLAMLLQQQPQASPAGDHEYSDLVPIKASEIYDNDVSEHSVPDRESKELRELFQFKDFIERSMDGRWVNFHLPQEPGYRPAKVMILTYVAEWCSNCNYEAPYLRDLYRKYNSRGLEIVARSEYSEVEKMRAVVQRHGTPYPVITGSIVAYDERERIRLETFQYLLRSTLGDKRTWGTPFSIIVLNGDLENLYVVMGEMKPEQVTGLVERALARTK